MDPFNQIVVRIIREQELIIGPIAWEEAKKVEGIKIQTNSKVLFEGNKTSAINNLVKQYSRLFGKASEEVCKDAVKDLISDLSAQEVPAVLR